MSYDLHYYCKFNKLHMCLKFLSCRSLNYTIILLNFIGILSSYEKSFSTVYRLSFWLKYLNDEFLLILNL